ncbi:MAG TPA: hypothetical protein VN281_08045, partial [Verrucomicrobiae bacterium]|nr:hypothetical protein [Verrucomicrobiae bacterium]
MHYFSIILGALPKISLIEMTSGVIKVLSVIGMVTHGVLFIASLGASGLSDSGSEHGSAGILFLLPFVYFAFCFITSFRSFKGPLLLPAGILAHVIIVPFYFRAVQDGIGIVAVLPLILAPCW